MGAPFCLERRAAQNVTVDREKEPVEKAGRERGENPVKTPGQGNPNQPQTRMNAGLQAKKRPSKSEGLDLLAEEEGFEPSIR